MARIQSWPYFFTLYNIRNEISEIISSVYKIKSFKVKILSIERQVKRSDITH